MKKVKNSILSFFLFLFKVVGLRPFSSADSNRILIVTTTGLGDTLWATPSIASIKASYPKAHIGVLTSPLGRQVLANSPYIDEFFILERSRLFRLPILIKKLRQSKFRTALIFHVSQRVSLPLIALSGVTNIFGTKGLTKDFDHLLTKATGKPNTVHEIERRLDISNLLPLKKRVDLLEIYPSEKDELIMHAKIKMDKSKPIIALHPGAKDKFKMWDTQNFAALGNKLVQELGAQIYITGSKEEKSLCENLASNISGATSLAGSLSILQTATFLSCTDLFVSNDTGPMHLGFAVNANTIALFCATDPKLCGPYLAKNSTVIQKQKTCHPCVGKKCKEPFCLLQISPEEVYTKALPFLTKNTLEVL